MTWIFTSSSLMEVSGILEGNASIFTWVSSTGSALIMPESGMAEVSGVWQ